MELSAAADDLNEVSVLLNVAHRLLLGFGMPGSYVVSEIEPAEGGGSKLHITWDRRGRTVFGKLFVGMLALTRGILIRRSFQLGLTRMAATQAHPDPAPSHGPPERDAHSA